MKRRNPNPADDLTKVQALNPDPAPRILFFRGMPVGLVFAAETARKSPQKSSERNDKDKENPDA